MKRITLLSVFIIGAIAITATLGAVVYRSASAATSSNQEADTSTQTDIDQDVEPSDYATGEKANRGRGKGLRSGISGEDLATALGISLEELQAAQEQAFLAGLEQAVEEGLITQVQADDLAEQNTAFPMGVRAQTWLENKGIDFEALLADALGISVEELQAAKAEAFNANIDQAVTDGTLTQDQADLLKGRYALRHDETFISSMKSAYEAALAQAVKDGVITQAQADLLLEKTSNIGSRLFDGMIERGGFREGRGNRMHGGQSSDTTPSAEEPSTTP